MAHVDATRREGLRADKNLVESSTCAGQAEWRALEAHGRRAAEKDDVVVGGNRTNTTSGFGVEDRGADESDSVLKELHTETPPISVPHSEGQFGAVDELGHLPSSPYHPRPSPLDHFARNRRPSISFNPEVTLDCGHQHGLDEPLAKHGAASPNASPHRRPASGLRRAHSEFESQRTKNVLGSPLSFQKTNGHDRTHPFSAAAPRMEDMSESDMARPTSLSLSSTSPVTEELRTPPDVPSDVLVSPLSASPAVHRALSLDDPNGWSHIMKQEEKPNSYTFGRHSSLGHAVRKSRRSTASSSKSPASAFLSMWSSDEVPPKPDDEGQMVGSDYVLGKQIGFGGFSTVKEAFKVNDKGETMHYAVKIVRKRIGGKSERENDQVQAEFDHEVRIWRYFHHAHVLPLDAVYETDHATFCFTRLTTGGTLFDLIRKHRQGLRMNLAKRYAYQLASAIRYLHEDARVVHRDIKLENCLLDRPDPSQSLDPDLILCDFGMAEWMSSENTSSSPAPYDNPADRAPPKNIGPSVTSTSVAGSLEYASPELLLSTGGLLSPAVDIWAFGVVVFALVVGTRPFQHSFKPKVQMNILAGHWDREAVLLKGDPDSQAHRDALDLIDGCLEMDCTKRWTIHDVLRSRWLKDCVSNLEERDAKPAQWKF
ncbi:hypothetical protein FQN54_006610 [Arachnomyces sp. PD_36]|nr:hypothetical protein FQN54_006610 [Arachnomyces sp. PD_36]